MTSNLARLARTLSVGLLIGPAALHVSFGQGATNPSRVDVAFEDSLPGWMAMSHVPGVAIAVLEGGRVTVVKTFGEVRKGVPLQADALWNVASLTKPVVAVTTLALVNTGSLSLDESLARYWVDPDIRDDTLRTRLTPRIVLSHQTGFPNWRWLVPTKRLEFLFAPGTAYKYSGEGFEYLRRALEAKFRTSLQQLSDSLLFTRAGMRETTYGWNPAADGQRFAVGHDTAGRALEEPKRTTADPNAADWLVTTIGDYSRFAEYVLAGAGLSPALSREMMTPQVRFAPGSHEAMGLGWEIMDGPAGDAPIVLHTGSDNGVKTLILLLPQSNRGLVVFTNGERGMEVVMRILKSSLHLKELTP
jgi:CubicO group peptidase (beta-lactamase class C family)